MNYFNGRKTARLLCAVALIGGLTACSSTDVTGGAGKQTFALASSTSSVGNTDLQKLHQQREAERKEKLAAEAAKRKQADKKRTLELARKKQESEAKRLAAFDQMTKALPDQQKAMLAPQRDMLVKSKDAAEQQVAKLTPRPVINSGAGGSSRYDGLIAAHAKANGIPVRLAHAVVRIESSFRPNARGAAGEIGLMQIKLSTARMMGYKGSAKALYHPENNIKYGMKYLGKAHKLAGGSTCGTILRYNAGHGAKSMNPISQRYCNKVQRYI